MRESRALWGWRFLQWFPGYAVGSPQVDLPSPQKNWASLGAQAYSEFVCLLFLNAYRALSFSKLVLQPSVSNLFTPQGLTGWPTSTFPVVREVGSGLESALLSLLIPGETRQVVSLAALCARPASTQAQGSEESSLGCCYKRRAALILLNCVTAREEFQAIREYSGFCIRQLNGSQGNYTPLLFVAIKTEFLVILLGIPRLTTLISQNRIFRHSIT